MKTVLGREPVLILAAVEALVALLVAFGVDVSTGQKAAVVAFLGAVLTLVTRSTVTPVEDPRLPGGVV